MKQRIESVTWKTRYKKISRQSSNQKKKKKTQKEQRGVKALQNNMKCNNIHIIGTPEGEEEEQGIENLFEK